MRIKAIDISKLAIYGIFLNYYCYNILTGSLIPMGTYLFFGVAILGIAFEMGNRPIKFGFEIKCWIGYFFSALITSVVAYSPSQAIDSLFKFIQRLILIILITLICEYEKSIIYAIRLLATTAVTCAFSSLLMMNDFSQKLKMSSGAVVSTNDIGSIMAFGCFAILFVFGIGKKSKVYQTVLKLTYIVAALSVIMIAGSRKSSLAIIITFVLMFVFCWRDYFKKMTGLQFVGILIIAVVTISVIYIYIWPYFEDTNMYARLFGRRVDDTAASDEIRIELYVTAIKDFFSHFLFGLGFDNYSTYHGGMYTHSTYVEPLACSGVFAFLYLIPYVHILINQIKLSFSKEEVYSKTNRVFQKEMLAFYIAFLFVGIGIPYLYKDIPCIVLAMYVSWQKISLDELGLQSYSKNGGNRYGENSNKSIAGYS